LNGGSNRLSLRLPRTWIANNPLTQADLTQEQAFLEARGFELRIEMRD
jgi:hypothetical protein